MKHLKLRVFSAATLCAGLLLTISGEAEAKVVLETGCKSKQASAVRDNFSKVRSMANQSIQKIELMDSSDKSKKKSAVDYYTTWFGAPTPTNVAHVKGVFQAVLNVFDEKQTYTARCNPPPRAPVNLRTRTPVGITSRSVTHTLRPSRPNIMIRCPASSCMS